MNETSSHVINQVGIHHLGDAPKSPLSTYFKNETVVHISCGWDHSAIVTDNGHVFTFGRNDFGKLGHGNTRISGPEPTLVSALGGTHVVQAACGYDFTFFLTSTGELFSCGHNGNGQIGLGLKTHSWLPLRVPDVPPFKKIVAGWGHSAVLTERGDLWVSGWNSQGQLGLGHLKNQTSFVCLSSLPGPIIDVSCGERHTVVLSASKCILVTGRNMEGQLGLGTYEDSCCFESLALPSAVLAVSCGSSHTVVLTEDRTVWSWGYNVAGQLGAGDKSDRNKPTKVIGIEDHRISDVIAGKHHTALLTEEGGVLVCGRGVTGELGQDKKDHMVAVTLKTSPGIMVSRLEFGWQYTLMLVAPQPQNM